MEFGDSVRLVQCVRQIMELLGEDLRRDDLIDTPARVVNLWQDFFTYNTQPPQPPEDIKLYPTNSEQVVGRVCEFVSMCEHHILVFAGKAYIAYLPNEHIIGMGHIDKVVRYWSGRLQLQERLTEQIASHLDDVLKPRGLMVVLKGMHYCNIIKGRPGELITSSCRGLAMKDVALKQEMMRVLGL